MEYRILWMKKVIFSKLHNASTKVNIIQHFFETFAYKLRVIYDTTQWWWMLDCRFNISFDWKMIANILKAVSFFFFRFKCTVARNIKFAFVCECFRVSNSNLFCRKYVWWIINYSRYKYYEIFYLIYVEGIIFH